MTLTTDEIRAELLECLTQVVLATLPANAMPAYCFLVRSNIQDKLDELRAATKREEIESAR